MPQYDRPLQVVGGVGVLELTIMPTPMMKHPHDCHVPQVLTTLETTQGQIDGFFSQLPHKCHQNRVASVGD